MTTNVNKVLEQRAESYGSYETHSIVSEGIMKVLEVANNYDKLPDHLLHTFKLIADKMTRAANGDYKHLDNLVDIIGYATLSLDILKKDK